MTDPLARDHPFRHLGERRVHEGAIWHVVVADYVGADGSTFRRDVVRSPGSVGVVPLVFDAEGLASVVLVAQYRPALDRIVLEIPAGMRDVAGEPPADTARRELVEEAGLQAGAIDHLVDLFPSPGMTDSVCSVYLATDCTPVDHAPQGPEEDDMELVHLPLDDALAMIDDGAIRDAKSVTGLLMTDRRLRSG